jgi:MutS domain V
MFSGDNEETYLPFKLPIMYINNNETYSLPKDVIDDLEISPVIHNKLFDASNKFGIEVSKEWCKKMTSNVKFLEDTQQVIKNMVKFKEISKVDTDVVIDIWEDTKCNKNFLEKYHYMDWDALLHLNQSPIFLQLISTVNVLSPLISLLIPLVILIIPYFILKFKGLSITFNSYITVLIDTAKKHFFGNNMHTVEMGWDKIAYLLVSSGLYVIQFYQNIYTCTQFYHNILKVNKNIINFKHYIDIMTEKMELFVKLNNTITYRDFCDDVQAHLKVLQELSKELSTISPFSINFKKSNEIGHMLKSYYDIKNHHLYDISLRYSVGFEGYIDNLSCVSKNIELGHLHFAKFDIKLKNSIKIKKQFYPPHLSNDVVIIPNDIELKKNIVVTGPNASGKTTLLKTTTINIILTQQFGCGFYKKCTINPYTHIHSYLNIPDTSERDSLFQAESRRCKNILDIVENSSNDSRHFCIFDELYSGTNPVEASKAAYSFLVYLSKYPNVNYLLTTHYTDVCEKLDKFSKNKQKNKRMVCNHMMDVIENDGNIEYLYRMVPGISRVEGGIQIFKEMNYPIEIIDCYRCIQ